jgi:catechol 2,3-dioxygenase
MSSTHSSPPSQPTRPSRPSVNHLVIAVRDIEASHRFYCDVLGFEQCGTLKTPFEPNPVMRFYRGHHDHHHDIALQQITDSSTATSPRRWEIFAASPGIAHIALAYGTRQEWLDQLEHLQAMEVPIALRGNHGMTHSAYVVDPDGNGIEVLYELPAEVWEGDVDAALSHFEPLPNKGAATLQDSTDYVRFSVHA